MIQNDSFFKIYSALFRTLPKLSFLEREDSQSPAMLCSARVNPRGAEGGFGLCAQLDIQSLIQPLSGREARVEGRIGTALPLVALNELGFTPRELGGAELPSINRAWSTTPRTQSMPTLLFKACFLP